MIDDNIFKRVLQNCRISLRDDEYVKIKKDLESILNAFRIIDEFCREDISPAYHPIDIYNVWRDDVPESFDAIDELLSLADVNHEGFIWAPRTKRNLK